jgi:hypothetical protein
MASVGFAACAAATAESSFAQSVAVAASAWRTSAAEKAAAEKAKAAKAKAASCHAALLRVLSRMAVGPAGKHALTLALAPTPALAPASAPAPAHTPATCLGSRHSLQQELPGVHEGHWTVTVEAVGSGVVLAPALQVDRHSTVGALRATIVGLRNACVRLFAGHGGAEIDEQADAVRMCDSGLSDGATIVVVAMPCAGRRGPRAERMCYHCQACTVCDPAHRHCNCFCCQSALCPNSNWTYWCEECGVCTCDSCSEGGCALCAGTVCCYRDREHE